MLGEVADTRTENLPVDNEEVNDQTPKPRRSDRPLARRDSEFEERIRPGSSRSRPSNGSTNKASDDASSMGERTPEAKRKLGGEKLKKKRRTKSKDRLIGEAEQKEFLDELEKEKGSQDTDDVEKPSHAVLEMQSGDEAESTGSKVASRDVEPNQADDTSIRARRKNKKHDNISNADNTSDHVLNNGKDMIESSDEELPFYLGHRKSMSVEDYNRGISTPLPPPAPPYDCPGQGDKKHQCGTEPAGTFSWDLEEHSSNIIIDDEKPNLLTRANSKKTTDGARGSVGLSSGRHEFEIEFKAAAWGSHCSVGVCTKNARLQKKGYHDLLGRDRHSWGWDIPSRELLHDGNTLGQWGGHVSDTPALIGLILDMDAGTLSVCLDGDYKNADIIFRDLDKANTPLYPAISTVYPGMEVTIREHQDPPPPVENTQEEEGGAARVIEPLIPEQYVAQEQVAVQDQHLEVVGAEKTGSDQEEEEAGTVSSQNVGDNSRVVDEGDTPSSVRDGGEAGVTDDIGNMTQQGVDGMDKSLSEGEDDTFVSKNDIAADVENEGNEGMENEERIERLEEETEQTAEEEHSDKEQAGEEEVPSRESSQLSGSDTKYSQEGEQMRAIESRSEHQQSATSEVVPQSESHLFSEQTSLSRESIRESRQQEAITYPNSIISDEEYAGMADRANSQVEEEMAEDVAENEVTVSSSHSKQSIPLSVSSLPDDDQYSLQVALGWDASMKGARVLRYPGIPQICMTEGNFEDKFQGIRSRVTVKSGCHRWRVKEVPMYVQQKKQIDTRTPTIPSSLDTRTPTIPSSLIVGIVDGEHRTFNYGFSLTQLGRHAWGWEPSKHIFWHGAVHKTFPEANDDQNGSLGIDLKLGLDIILDCDRKTLKFEYQGITFDASKCYTLYGKEYAPFIVFKGKALAPIKLEYVSGPEDFIEERLAIIRKLKRIDIEDFINFRSSSVYVTASSNLSLLEEKHVANFRWGLMSSGVSMGEGGGHEVTFSSPGRQVAISSFSMSSNRHTIDLTYSGIDNLTLGFVCPTASQEKLLNDPGLLGSDLHSWAWFVPGGWLVHGGCPIGRYPYMLGDFDVATLSTIRVVLTFSPAGTAVSFAALTQNGNMTDLGIGFINLPSQLWMVVTGNAAGTGEKSSVKMVYKSGPTGFVEELQAMTSRVCAIL